MRYKILFRTDASLLIGTGHTMRCLTLAKELRAAGLEVEFITKNQEHNLFEEIISSGFKAHLISSNNESEDIRETLDIIDENSIVIIDHYELEYNWEINISKRAKKIIVIDDLANRRHLCDILIDPTFGDVESKYKELVPKSCRLFVGEKYIFLRDEFISSPKCSIRDKNNIVIHIFFGGNDIWDYSYNYSKWILDELKAINIKLVIGKSYQKLDELEALREKYIDRFEVYQDVENMAEIMNCCNLAIGSPGNATWERMALGLPTIYLANNKNQILILEKLKNANLCLFLGMADEITKKQFIEVLKHFINQFKLQKDISKKGITLIDGLGKKRVAQIIRNLTEEL